MKLFFLCVLSLDELGEDELAELVVDFLKTFVSSLNINVEVDVLKPSVERLVKGLLEKSENQTYLTFQEFLVTNTIYILLYVQEILFF